MDPLDLGGLARVAAVGQDDAVTGEGAVVGVVAPVAAVGVKVLAPAFFCSYRAVRASNQKRTPSSPGPRPSSTSSAAFRARAYTRARRIVPLNSLVGFSTSPARESEAVLLLGLRSVFFVAFASPSTYRVSVPASASKTPAT